MSKFGEDNGSKTNGRPVDQTSLNGFRLDSSQSSWLMDRLDALSEEDKIAMRAAQEELQQNEGETPYINSPEGVEPSTIDPNYVSPAQLIQGQQQDHSAKTGLEHGQGQYIQPADTYNAHDENEPEENAVYHMGSGRDPHERDGNQSDLLKEKIESLEQQLAEISNLTGAAAQDVQDFDEYQADDEAELAQEPEEEGHYLSPEHGEYYQAHETEAPLSGQQIVENSPHPHGETASGHPTGQQPVYQGPDGQLHMVPDYNYHQPGAPIEPRTIPMSGGQQPQGVVSDYNQPHSTAHHPHYQGQSTEVVEGHERAELPQFLSPAQPQRRGRSGFISLLGGLVTLAIVGGMAYTYLDEGVSDVVKSDFGGISNYKQPAKLSESQTIDKGARDKSDAGKVDVAVVTPADLERDFGVAQVAGVAGKQVPVNVRLPRGQFPSGFVVMRDLPNWAKLNKGRFVNGPWIIGLNDLDGLEMTIPEDKAGTFSFVVEFVSSTDKDPIVRTVSAIIAPAEKAEQIVEQESEEAVVANLPKQDDEKDQIKSPAGQSNQNTLIIDEALEEKWLERGTRLLRSGDVSAARLAFSHLAEQGSGRGALAMAMTFDPNQPSARVVVGIKPDSERAKFWYERALSLGNEAAREPLRLLEVDTR